MDADYLQSLHPAVREHFATVFDLPARPCQVLPLTRNDGVRLLQQTLLLLEHNYVHLPLKREMHAVDPVGRLTLLLRDVQNGPDRLDDDFHRELLDILRPVRDRHLTYVLPTTSEDCIAFLPFMVEEIKEKGRRTYIVSQCLMGFADGQFEPGVEVVSWNGVQIGRALSDHASRQAGCSPHARRAQGVKALTLRVLQHHAVPDEEWVVVGCRTLAGALIERKFSWKVARERRRKSPGSAVTDPDLDLPLETMQRMQLAIFAPRVTEKARLCLARPGHTDFSYARIDGKAGRAFGYIRIWGFARNLTERTFVDKFMRLLKQVPSGGLIIDVRGNPGGKIAAGECILQMLTQRRIAPELFQFRNTPLNLRICIKGRGDDQLDRWILSIQEGLQNGDVYSAGFPKTDVAACNSVGRKYFGPVVLIVDALSFSAADIFAAGFQDHEIGPILGVHRTTGGGGANSLFHEDLHELGLRNSPYEDLPRGTALKIALRRSLRVGRNAGRVLEEFGVTADAVHELTRNDVLNCDVDLIGKAVSMLTASRRARR